MQKKIDQMLSSKDIAKYSSRGVKSILANLMLKILIENNLSPIRCEELVSQHVRRMKNKGEVSKHFNKSTIKRELENKQLTWNKFVGLLEVFRAAKINLHLAIEWASGTTTIHNTGTIVISEIDTSDVWEYANNGQEETLKIGDTDTILSIVREDLNASK